MEIIQLPPCVFCQNIRGVISFKGRNICPACLEELKKLRKTFDDFPQAYAFEFEEWETILGWDVYEGNLEELGLLKMDVRIVR